MSQSYRDRIARLNPALTAFLDTLPPSGDGLAVGVKSNIAVKGLPCHAGIAAYADAIANEDAEIVSRLRAAGADILGTLNMHEGALGATTDNLHFGRCQNPWREGYTPGGSSGGSGAAVAAGLCDFALGSDTMGSVRIPAAYCGVQGHKPTTDVVPTNGVLALSTTLDHVGPLGRDVQMLWQSMHILAGWGDAPELNPTDLSDLRIGIWDGEGDVDLTDAVRKGFTEVVSRIRAQGSNCKPFTPPNYDYSRSRRVGLLISEVEGAKIHGIAAGDDQREGFTEDFFKLLAWGIKQPVEKVDAAYGHLVDVRDAAQTVWNDLNFIIAPTAPQQAFLFSDPAPANQADFTAWADFAALPATAIFTGLCADGLPLSCQIIGPEGCDRETLKVAAALEALFGSPPPPPGYEL